MPFVRELDYRKVNSNAVLAANGLIREQVFDRSIFVPQITIHRFLEEAAHAAGDPYFGACVGELLNWSEWTPILDAAAQSRNLASFLIRFIHVMGSEASSAYQGLDIRSEFAIFKERRTTEQEMLPAQNDAFTAAYMLSLLRNAAGQVWEPARVRLTVCDTKALPDRYLGVHVFGGDRTGITIRFPSGWLVEQFNRKSFIQLDKSEERPRDIPISFIDSLQHVAIQHLHEAELNLTSVADLVGLSSQALQRRLRADGTTLSAVVRDLKKKKAVDALLQTDRPIGEIAAALGFQNPTSFTRAFKTWTDVSPREYRKKHRNT